MTTEQHNTETPSGRIRHALEAMEWFEQQPNCVIDMRAFYYVDDRKCFACYGGAAVLRKWNVPIPFKSAEEARSTLWERANGVHAIYQCSLDSFRVGDVSFGFEEMGLFYEEREKFDREITDYHRDREQFFADMNKLADDLEAEGY